VSGVGQNQGMAITQCSECGGKVSTRATACPHCGCPVEPQITCPDCGEDFAASLVACPVCGGPVAVPETPKEFSAPSQDPREVTAKKPIPESARKDSKGEKTQQETFHWFMAVFVGATVRQVVSSLEGISDLAMAVYLAYGELASLWIAGLTSGLLVVAPALLLLKYGKKKSSKFYAGTGFTGVGVLSIAIATPVLGWLALVVFLLVLMDKAGVVTGIKEGFAADAGPQEAAEEEWARLMPVKSYFDNGQLRVRMVVQKDGKWDGPYESYHENGQLWQKATYTAGKYTAGKPDGPFEQYYENGQLEEKGTYNMGEQCGEWIENGETVTYDPCPPD
jgi:hypothetical protein